MKCKQGSRSRSPSVQPMPRSPGSPDKGKQRSDSISILKDVKHEKMNKKRTYVTVSSSPEPIPINQSSAKYNKQPQHSSSRPRQYSSSPEPLSASKYRRQYISSPEPLSKRQSFNFGEFTRKEARGHRRRYSSSPEPLVKSRTKYSSSPEPASVRHRRQHSSSPEPPPSRSAKRFVYMPD